MTTAAKASPAEFFAENSGYLRSGLKRFFSTERELWISFVIPFFTLLISYFCFTVYPFGERSVLSLDLNAQYVYYYDYMYDVFAGKESLFYSWSRTLSGEFMGIIGYYAASPFNFLMWMWPRECITEGLLTVMVTKVGAIGLCTAVYLSRGKGYSRITTVIFSSCYALCAYAIEQTMNPMWLDGVMILPIVVYGIESLIDKGRFRMLTLSLVYAFVTCFYIGFMIAIFAGIYFFYYSAVSHELKGFGTFIKRGVLFTVVAVVSTLMSMFMLLPVYFSLSYGKFDFSPNVTQATEITVNFDLIELFDKLFPATYDTCRMSGLPFIYCGTIVIILLPCYFFSKSIRGRDRIATAALMIVLCVSMYIKQVDMLWHGGQLPNWLPNRYSFMLSFIMTVMAAKAFDGRAEIPKKYITFSSLGWFLILLYIEQADNYLEDIKRDTMDGLTVVLPAMFVLFLVGAALVQTKDRLDKKKRWAVVLAAVLCAEGLYNTIAQLYRQHADIVYSTRPSYVNVIVPTRQAVEEIKAKDDGFYRMEKTYFRAVNDPIAVNMYGLSHSSSMLNAKPIKLLGDLGFTSRSHYTRYSGATLITKSIFGVKYELSCPDDSTANLKSRGDITVTENECALPMAYLADADYFDLTLKEKDPFTNQNRLLASMLGSETTPKYFTRISNSEETPIDLQLNNVTKSKTTDGHHMFKVIEKGKNAEILYTFNMPETSSLYMFLPTKYERTVNVWLNREKFLDTYFEGDNNSIMKIGDFEKGEKVIIGLTLKKDDLYFKEAQFVYENRPLIEADLKKIQEINQSTVVTRPTPTTMRVEVEADEDKLLFTSIPEEKGWKVYVDGVEAEFIEPDEDGKLTYEASADKPVYMTALGALYSVPLTKGKHTVEFSFTTAGYPEALFITAFGVALFIGMIFIKRRFFPDAAAKAEAEGSYDPESGEDIPAPEDAPEDEPEDYDDDFDEDEMYGGNEEAPTDPTEINFQK